MSILLVARRTSSVSVGRKTMPQMRCSGFKRMAVQAVSEIPN